MKTMYSKPQVEIQSVSADTHVMVLPSPSGPEPQQNGAPSHRGLVPGGQFIEA